MWRRASWTGLLVLFAVSAIWAGPVNGPPSQNYPIAPATDEPTPKEFTVTFQGGERACVIVRGGHKPLVPLDVTVFDKNGAVVARDESDRDFLAVFWVPPRTADYRIVIRNKGNEEFREYREEDKFAKIYIVFK
jgi:hypothetical protein